MASVMKRRRVTSSEAVRVASPERGRTRGASQPVLGFRVYATRPHVLSVRCLTDLWEAESRPRGDEGSSRLVVPAWVSILTLASTGMRLVTALPWLTSWRLAAGG